MKKFLILFLVLGVASISQAGTAWLAVDAGSTVEAGKTIQINLLADTSAASFGIGACQSSDTDGTITGTVGNEEAIHQGGDATSGNMSIDAYGYVDNYQGLLFDVASGSVGSSENVDAGDIIMYFEYIIPGDWDGSEFTIDFVAEGDTYYYDEGSSDTASKSYVSYGLNDDSVITGVTIIPEPMTIGLLGLGCLFLKRRK